MTDAQLIEKLRFQVSALREIITIFQADNNFRSEIFRRRPPPQLPSIVFEDMGKD